MIENESQQQPDVHPNQLRLFEDEHVPKDKAYIIDTDMPDCNCCFGFGATNHVVGCLYGEWMLRNGVINLPVAYPF
jgi:hypothetical protein